MGNGASPGAVLEDGLLLSWQRQMQMQSWKVDLQQQSPSRRACLMQGWEMRPVWLLQPGPRGVQPAQRRMLLYIYKQEQAGGMTWLYLPQWHVKVNSPDELIINLPPLLCFHASLYE